MTDTLHAWCFDHGMLHHFTGEPWCTARWVAFTATTETDALDAKQHAYGDARFLHELPAQQQLDVIEIRRARP
ncbi:hypothetical protein [Streptomyces naphthomycinicus]|uniref:hypothetical protein n=1 Tax=Streptomyces naphthomycinicus TaxID=2872625 RepID=UPI001CEDBD0C|nr:hypothetical protein [Streptomyces sp. TML10]